MTTPTPRQRLEDLCRRQFYWLAAQDVSRQLVADLLAELTAAVAELERLEERVNEVEQRKVGEMK